VQTNEIWLLELQAVLGPEVQLEVCLGAADYDSRSIRGATRDHHQVEARDLARWWCHT